MGPVIWARRISSVVACVAAVVLIGWVLHIQQLTSFIPQRSGTRPESAAAFLFGAAAVWGLTSTSPRRRRLGAFASLICGGIGVAALLTQGFAPLASVERLLTGRSLAGATISVPTALGLCCIACALILSQARSRRALRVFDLAVVLSLSGGTLGVLASLYGWYEARALAIAFRNTAMPSGIAITGLAISAALLRPERGLLAAVLEPAPSGALLRRLLPAAILLPALTGFLASWANLRGWFPGYGNAPFAVAEIVGIVWLVALSARLVRRFHAQREAAQRALQDEMAALHEAREALIVSEARFRVALQARDFIVWTQDADLRYTWTYNTAPDHGSHLEKTDHDMLERPDEADVLHAIKRHVLETGEPFSGQVAVTQHGTTSFFEMRITRMLDEEGHTIGIAGAAYDITGRKRADEALLNVQKYESVARLAGGVAHDFNNLLTGIIGNADYALGKLPLDMAPGVRAALQRVVDAGESAASLTQQLLAYAGKGRFHVEPTDLARLKDSLAVLVRASIPSGIQLDFDVPADVPLVRGDASQLQQLLTNLLMNAVEAIGEARGHVTMRMRAVTLDQDAARALDVQEPRDELYVQIEVSDDGPGMPETTLKRAFEPFFSTKFVGRGLGLSAAQGIARAHGGGILVRSSPGIGTTIVVTLPALRTANEVEPIAATRPESFLRARPVAGAGVLFVDDEPHLREIGRLALSEAGYRVWLAVNGAEALEVARATGDLIDVIVLDMTMPVMSGAEAARRLRDEGVNVPIVASSGYSETETLERFGDIAPLFLRKPYRTSDLLRMVARAMEDTHKGARCAK